MATLTNMQRVNLGPLTSTWTPPPACTVPVGASESNFTIAWEGQACDPVLGPSDTTICYPPASSGVPSPTAPFLGWGFYSPGVVCPAGYTAACSATGGGASDWFVQFSVKAGETAVGCCPTGYTCTNYNGQTCGTVAVSTTVSTATCQASGTGSVIVHRTLPDTTVSLTSLTVFAPLYQLNHYSSDLASSTSSSSSSSSSISSSSTAPTAASSNTGPTGGDSEHVDSSGRLSAGAKAGIAIGAALAAIALAVGAFLLFQRYRRNKAARMPQEMAASEQDPYQSAGYISELDAKHGYMAPMPPKPPQEMSAPLRSVHEMQTSAPAYELAGPYDYNQHQGR